MPELCPNRYREITLKMTQRPSSVRCLRVCKHAEKASHPYALVVPGLPLDVRFFLRDLLRRCDEDHVGGHLDNQTRLYDQTTSDLKLIR